MKMQLIFSVIKTLKQDNILQQLNADFRERFNDCKEAFIWASLFVILEGFIIRLTAAT